jgi:putative ABC transport system ATP-binding protein
MTLVECRDLSRTFGSGSTAIVAVHAATCSIDSSARAALVGASGSGKSTLVHLLAGLDHPTAGEIRWPGLPDGPQQPGAIGVVFQGASLMDPLTVTQNVAFPLLLQGMTEADATRRAATALRRLDIAALADSIPDELSGGQAQRVAVARVLAMQPRVIFADEPTGQLDETTASGVIDVLIAAADLLGAGLVIATHDAYVASRLSARWTMSDGRLRVRDRGLAAQPHS